MLDDLVKNQVDVEILEGLVQHLNEPLVLTIEYLPGNSFPYKVFSKKGWLQGESLLRGLIAEVKKNI